MVAAAIAWMEPGSGVSGFCGNAAMLQTRDNRSKLDARNMEPPGSVRPKFTTQYLLLGRAKKITTKVTKVHEGSPFYLFPSYDFVTRVVEIFACSPLIALPVVL